MPISSHAKDLWDVPSSPEVKVRQPTKSKSERSKTVTTIKATRGLRAKIASLGYETESDVADGDDGETTARERKRRKLETQEGPLRSRRDANNNIKPVNTLSDDEVSSLEAMPKKDGLSPGAPGDGTAQKSCRISSRHRRRDSSPDQIATIHPGNNVGANSEVQRRHETGGVSSNGTLAAGDEEGPPTDGLAGLREKDDLDVSPATRPVQPRPRGRPRKEAGVAKERPIIVEGCHGKENDATTTGAKKRGRPRKKAAASKGDTRISGDAPSVFNSHADDAISKGVPIEGRVEGGPRKYTEPANATENSSAEKVGSGLAEVVAEVDAEVDAEADAEVDAEVHAGVEGAVGAEAEDCRQHPPKGSCLVVSRSPTTTQNHEERAGAVSRSSRTEAAAKPAYRVGLSKKSRIAPLLKSFRK
ncbi:hypothetical protein RJ55_00552 [Drechmeria coniospora]|nr:hypothetical protein RJ55_00552 [Drechmeria coniospora]